MTFIFLKILVTATIIVIVSEIAKVHDKKLMKCFTTLIIILSSSVFFCFGQKTTPFDPSNARLGESVEYCHTHKKMTALLNDPAYRQSKDLSDQEFQEKLNKPVEYQKGVVYTIPVVFHVLHMNGIENISHDQILDAVAVLNRDFRLQNADANNVENATTAVSNNFFISFLFLTLIWGQRYKRIFDIALFFLTFIHI